MYKLKKGRKGYLTPTKRAIRNPPPHFKRRDMDFNFCISRVGDKTYTKNVDRDNKFLAHFLLLKIILVLKKLIPSSSIIMYILSPTELIQKSYKFLSCVLRKKMDISERKFCISPFRMGNFIYSIQLARGE